MASIFELSARERFSLAGTFSKYGIEIAHASPHLLIAGLEAALSDSPDNWLTLFVLADNYQQVGRYQDALALTERLVKLRPDDIRSAYAHATSFNMLLRALWAGESRAKALRSPLFAGEEVYFDPGQSRDELSKTGLSLGEAATGAAYWFDRALRLDPDARSREQIEQDLAAIYHNCPRLAATPLPDVSYQRGPVRREQRIRGSDGKAPYLVTFFAIGVVCTVIVLFPQLEKLLGKIQVTPAPTPQSTPAPPNLQAYTSAELGFSCSVPDSYTYEEDQTSDRGEQQRNVRFYPANDRSSRKGPVLLVQVAQVPNPDSPTAKSINGEMLRTFIEESLRSDTNVRMVVTPRLVEIAGYPAVESVVDSLTTDGRAYLAYLKTYDRYFALEVSGAASNDTELHEAYSRLTASFEVK